VLGGTDVAQAVVQAARDAMVEHVLVGERVRSRALESLRPSIIDRIIDGVPGTDVHVIARVVQ
jgi:K+-sensing histidine kinase KdpD